MKICGGCKKKMFPVAMVIFLSTFIAFVTWLTLSAAGLPDSANRLWTFGAFFIAAAILGSYMVSCIRRHCFDEHGS